jgi:hypothetical protein
MKGPNAIIANNIMKILFVRHCQIKTTPGVEKKDLLNLQTAGCLPWDQDAAAWLE